MKKTALLIVLLAATVCFAGERSNPFAGDEQAAAEGKHTFNAGEE